MAGPILFRIFYSTSFTILNIILLALILITPADSIQQALLNNQAYYIFVIAGCYVLTLVLAILIYASRLYTTRSVLAAIPKTWIPVEKGDVTKKVRKMIADGLARSAVLAWHARPHKTSDLNQSRDAIAAVPESEDKELPLAEPQSQKDSRKFFKWFRRNEDSSNRDELQIQMPLHIPAWDNIGHNGWSSPDSPDLPNLQYTVVILELPHLIEAKAVSLAPPDPDSTTTPPLPDLRGVELLQRPAPMGLRDYVSHLTSVGIFSQEAPIGSFLASYEKARFAFHPIPEIQFRHLMKLFAEILRSMIPLDPSLLESSDEDSDIDGDASSSTTPESIGSHSPNPEHRTASPAGSEGTFDSKSPDPVTNRSRSRTQPTFAPATPRSKRRDQLTQRNASAESFSQTRRPYAISQSSSSSLRSGSQGSVIKLSSSQDPDDLPYTLNVTSFG